jgi:hypothetical protein
MKYLPPFFLFLIVLAPFPAAGAEILDRRIEVNFRNVPLSQALTEVARLAQFEWSYNAEIIKKDARATLQVRDWPVREVLYALLGSDYQFKPNGNYLILKRLKKPAGELSGYLKDPVTGQRISGATVYDKKTLRATTTDKDGYYQLKVRNRSEVVVSKLAYRDTLLRVESNSPRFQNLELSLEPAQPLPPPDKPGLLGEAQRTGAQIERFFRTGVRQWEQWNVRAPLYRRMQVSLLPGVGTNRALSAQVSNRWSLNLIAGVSRNVEALEIGGVANFTKENLSGVQIGGVLNILHGDAAGAQIAGIFNETGGTVGGAQVAGIVNHAKEIRSAGVQVAGIANVTGRVETGGQIAGIVNVADKVEGVQISGIYNRCAPLRGIQIGLVNKADSVAGVQIGLVNKADRLSGVQIGLVNKSAVRSGFQLGLVNKSGHKKRLLLNW